jgi:2-keto-3-deoxy-6-phosphogluconate aldolase
MLGKKAKLPIIWHDEQFKINEAVTASSALMTLGLEVLEIMQRTAEWDAATMDEIRDVADRLKLVRDTDPFRYKLDVQE